MRLTWRKISENGNLSQWVKDLAGKCGVYLVRAGPEWFRWESHALLYIGESHKGRLKKTLLRHFQEWDGDTSGPTFGRDAVEVAVLPVDAKKAVKLQNALIAKWQPKINVIGKEVLESEGDDTADEVPF